jgi:hypothetical protein
MLARDISQSRLASPERFCVFLGRRVLLGGSACAQMFPCATRLLFSRLPPVVASTLHTVRASPSPSQTTTKRVNRYMNSPTGSNDLFGYISWNSKMTMAEDNFRDNGLDATNRSPGKQPMTRQVINMIFNSNESEEFCWRSQDLSALCASRESSMGDQMSAHPSAAEDPQAPFRSIDAVAGLMSSSNGPMPHPFTGQLWASRDSIFASIEPLPLDSVDTMEGQQQHQHQQQYTEVPDEEDRKIGVTPGWESAEGEFTSREWSSGNFKEVNYSPEMFKTGDSALTPPTVCPTWSGDMYLANLANPVENSKEGRSVARPPDWCGGPTALANLASPVENSKEGRSVARLPMRSGGPTDLANLASPVENSKERRSVARLPMRRCGPTDLATAPRGNLETPLQNNATGRATQPPGKDPASARKASRKPRPAKPKKTGTAATPTKYPSRRVEPREKEYVIPTDDDILMGRGGRSNNHPGNERYRQAIEELKPKYRCCEKYEKTILSQTLVEDLMKEGKKKPNNYFGCIRTYLSLWSHFLASFSSSGRRFIKLDEGTRSWYIVPILVARRKAGQALREENTPEARKEKRERYANNK